MNRIRINEDIKPMSEFRSGITSFIKQIHSTKRPMVITQHGKSVAVLVDAAEFENMQDKLELFEEIQKASKQIEEGKGTDHQIVQDMLMKRMEE